MRVGELRKKLAELPGSPSVRVKLPDGSTRTVSHITAQLEEDFDGGGWYSFIQLELES